MAFDEGFLAYVSEQCEQLGQIIVKKMFGGAGLYLDGVLFGFVADSSLYLKVDDTNKADFEARGMGPFVFTGKGKPMEMSYFELPEDILDDVDELSTWVNKAATAYLNSKKK